MNSVLLESAFLVEVKSRRDFHFMRSCFVSMGYKRMIDIVVTHIDRKYMDPNYVSYNCIQLFRGKCSSIRRFKMKESFYTDRSFLP
jgi:hypothetical protein